jgi:modification methylase
VLLASTGIDDIVLDPFTGTGTTAAMARRLRRRFIGIERHPDYAEAAIGRFRRERPLPMDSVVASPAKRDAPRVPFGSLVERGLVPPGTRVTDKQKRVSAIVAPDGTLVSGSRRGSIHKLGAELTNAPSCNGWTFWHFERDGVLIALDVVRGESIVVANDEAV